MKLTRKHTTIFSHFLVILSGIVLYSFFPVDTQIGKEESSHLVTSNNYYNPADEAPEKDFKYSNDIFELVFKETEENKESSGGMNGLAVIKQGITATEVGFINFTLDKSYFFKRARHLSIDDFSLRFLNKTINYFSFPFQPFANSIAINAP